MHRYSYSISQVQRSWNCGFPSSCAGRRGRTQPLEKESARLALDAQITRHGDRPGPLTYAVVYLRASCLPRSRKREKRPAAGGDELKKWLFTV